jgi:DNA-binding winged helix-turn-helix (wHTH) protein
LAREISVIYRFDQFVVDGDTRRLLRDREEIHLSPKALHLLQILIENRHRAVSKADLQKELWPSTFVVDTNLASLIREVRQALDDTAETPRFVRTVHRFGYWFIGEIRDEDVSGRPAEPKIRCWLVWASRQIPIDGGEYILGRAPDASVWVDAPGVSRHHARLVLSGQEATVEDLGSKNGTFVGNELVTSPRRLNDGDTIRLGPVVITFRIPPSAGLTDTVALD